MANAKVGQTSGKTLDYNDLLPLLRPERLDSVYREFMHLTNAPPNLNCLLIVAANLYRTFRRLRAWRQLPPFQGWPRLMLFLHGRAKEIEMQFGEIVKPLVPTDGDLGTSWLKKTFQGEIELRPFYVMLCCQRIEPKLDVRYGALQLQILYARWAEMQAVRAANASPIPLRSRQGKSSSATRLERLPDPYARAVRDLSGPHFTGLLKYLRPEQLPDAFVSTPGIGLFPLRKDYPDRFNRILCYCRRHGGARQFRFRTATSQEIRQTPYPEYVGYTEFQFGVKLDAAGGEDEQARVDQEAIFERRISEERALELGLDPQEVGQGSVDILNEVPGASNSEEAHQIARARVRSWEIDKSLFNWRAQALRIDEVKVDIIPALRRALDDERISSEDLAAATAVGIAIDTGRDLDRVLKLKIEALPASEFAFQPPTKQDPARWYWPTIGPLYKSELQVPPAMSEDRADHLCFQAAPLVCDLIQKHLKHQKNRSGIAFRDKKTGEWVRDWIKLNDPGQRITLNRLSHLRWNALHRLTGGEHAIACLVLGVPRTPAAVQLHYAVLSSWEAARLFEETSRAIWGEECAPGNGRAGGSNRDAYSGCRAFPTREAVKETVRWLRNGSRHFFGIDPIDFSARRHGQFQNRAVLYLLWHQFYAFGTRAIKDCYQTRDGFTRDTDPAIGILSDKDFANGYKTRVILANSALLGHMCAMEKRLVLIAKELKIVGKVRAFPIWLIDGDSQPVFPITPTEISTAFGTRFAFPVNTPRKIMRNLLREKSVSHEHAEAYMGHWSHGREPWSSYSSFDFGEFIAVMQKAIPACLRDLGFNWFPTEDMT